MYEAYKKPNLEYKFQRSDGTMTFRFPTSEDQMALERYLADGPLLIEAKIFQLACLLVETSLKDSDGDPLIMESDGLDVIYLILCQMPMALIAELHEALITYYPDWKLTE